MPRPISERTVVLLIGAAQFVNILDFVIVMPLGPDFANALAIPTSTLGYIGGSYTAAAAVSGLLGSFFLDRFDRKRALAVALFGLGVATALAATATGLGTLLVARVVAGLFGGPATSLSFAIIADVIPSERRGKAMGAVMGAFSIASVLGVPAGLELARQGGWRLPFLAVASLCLVVVALVAVLLPPMRRHLEARAGPAPSFASLVRPTVLLSWTMTAVTMAAGFLIIPNVSAHVQQNLGYPRELLGVLYLVGGVASFFSMRAAGRLIDRFGSFPVGTFGSGALVLVLYFAFVSFGPRTPVLPLFIGFLVALAFRNVSHTTLASKVPSLVERARFMSIQSAVQHAASAGGAFLSSKLLTETAGGRLEGVPNIAWLSIALTAALPLLMRAVEKRVRRPLPAPARPEPVTGITAPDATRPARRDGTAGEPPR